MTKPFLYIAVLLFVCAAACTSPKVFTANYYAEHEKGLVDLESSYKKIYTQHPFSVGFTDRSFEYVSVEIITDSIKYINEFSLTDTRLQDTLSKYHFPVENVLKLILQMKDIHCSWINTLDYYTNNQKRTLVFMSVKPVTVRLPFSRQKYFILTFFQQPQYYDAEGNLLAGRRLRKLRKINDETFRRINDKVAYTVSGSFR